MSRLPKLLATFVLLSVAASAAATGEGAAMFVGATSTELTGPEGASLGQLTLATEVRVEGEGADTAEIQLQGWSMEAGPSVVFYGREKRVRLATLTEEGQEVREVVDTVEDDFGTVWQQVRVVGSVSSGDLTADVQQIWAEGQALNQSRCGACHSVHPPDDFTANQWPGTIDAMVPAYASLSDEELVLLTKYVQYNASDWE